MPRFAANISTMFTELPTVERIGAAARAGFAAIECQFPYEIPAETMRQALDEAGIPLVLINTPPGDFDAGERGLAAIPGREQDFARSMDQALAYAAVTGTRQIHVMAGIRPDAAPLAECLAQFERQITKAAVMANGLEIDRLLIEPINGRDIPGYTLSRLDLAEALLERLANPKIRLQFDFYHVQIIQGDLLRSFERLLPLIGHVQIAGVPERHEPDEGEIDCHQLFAAVDRLGYAGWIGAEYFPAARTEDGLGWAFRYGISPKPTVLATGGERL